MRTFGLVGKKLSHSFSKDYFTNKFQLEKLEDCEYKNFEIDHVLALKELVENDYSIQGLNVTIPYKQVVIPVLDEIDLVAKEVGAVNTIKVLRKEDKITLKGYNTDVYGFQFSIKPFLTLNHQKALIFGTGGAAMAVAYVLKNLGIDYLFVSRTKNEGNIVNFETINEFAIKNYKLLINCTPIGMFPDIDKVLSIPYSAITSEHLCVDLIYNPIKSKFLLHAENKGATILNGLSMLHLQADKSFEIFIQK